MLFSAALLMIMFLPSCDKENNTNNNPTIPDAIFNASVSGAESYTFSFTLPKGTAGSYAVNGSCNSTVGLFTMLAKQMPTGWAISLSSSGNQVKVGTYTMNTVNGAISSFANASQTTAYTSTSGSITITKAVLYQNVGPAADWYVDGSFSTTMVDNSNPPNQITVTGDFTGINIKAQ